ncbi:MAG: MerR family transcriptional regulator [[Clostridium] scindens]
MKKPGYYSSGEFARMAHVTLRTIRYYDKQNILKPSYVTDAGARFYTDEDFARLQQILLLKYLGFSLDDIREMTIADSDYHFMLNSLNIQLKAGSGSDRADAAWWRRQFRILPMRSRQSIRLTGARC